MDYLHELRRATRNLKAAGYDGWALPQDFGGWRGCDLTCKGEPGYVSEDGSFADADILVADGVAERKRLGPHTCQYRALFVWNLT